MAQVEITLPEDAVAGQRLALSFEGANFEFIVPDGAVGGSKVRIAVQAADAARWSSHLSATEREAQRAQREAEREARWAAAEAHRAANEAYREAERERRNQDRQAAEVEACLNRVLKAVERQVRACMLTLPRLLPPCLPPSPTFSHLLPPTR